MKRALLVSFAVLALFASAVAVAAWEPWRSKEREREVAWLEAFAGWTRSAEGTADCAESYDAQVGEPPRRLAEADRLAREGCSSGDLVGARRALVALVTEERRRRSAPQPSPELASYAAPLAATEHPKVYCWRDPDWAELSEDWSLVELDEFRLAGFADPATGSMHLAPYVCEPLDRFFGGDYAPNLNEESLDLAASLVTLAHEAEHLRSPDASEADVECVAIQRVRDLVRAAGRGKPYENLMAGLAWDVGYPDMPPDYRTGACRDGGALDVRPDTSVWP